MPKYRASKFNNQWFCQVSFNNDWQYIRFRFMSGDFSYGYEPAFDFSFSSRKKAEKYLLEKVKPYYEPNIEHGEELTTIQVSESEKCMFDLMKRMLQAESDGDLNLANKLNDELIEVHSKIGKKQKLKKSIVDKIKSIFSNA